MPRGEALSLVATWELARAWYHNRMAPEYRGRAIEQIEAIFGGLGMTSPFWYLPDRAAPTPKG